MAPANAWKLTGLCASHPERYTLWFPTFETPAAEIQRAKDICDQCPVRAQCKAAGKRQYGVWGGVLYRLDPGDFEEETL